MIVTSGSGMALASIQLAIRVSEELAKQRGGKPEDYFDPARVSNWRE